MTILRLPFSKMKELRKTYKELDKVMSEYEAYIDENGLPF
jgi:hypothetical protein